MSGLFNVRNAPILVNISKRSIKFVAFHCIIGTIWTVGDVDICKFSRKVSRKVLYKVLCWASCGKRDVH